MRRASRKVGKGFLNALSKARAADRRAAQGIAARSDETPQEVRPAGQEPDPGGDAPTPTGPVEVPSTLAALATDGAERESR
jgi:hypothetical protein